MNSRLQTTLAAHLKSGWQSNPALRTLVQDYTKYHAVLVIMGAVVLLASVMLSILFWIRFKRIPRIRRFAWPFEKKVYFCFGLTLATFSLLLALVCAANLSTTLKPLPGFTSLASSTTVPSDSVVGRALITWVQSGNNTLPPILRQKVQDRINWQKPKAVICGLLLILFVIASILLWGYILEKSRTSEPKWSYKDRLLVITGIATFSGCLLLVIMVIANAQGAMGPIAISLLGVGG